MSIKETGKCCLCGGEYTMYGCNPAPICTIPDARCCHKCNWKHVLPARGIHLCMTYEKYIKDVEASKNCCQYERAPHPLCKGCCNIACQYHMFL